MDQKKAGPFDGWKMVVRTLSLEVYCSWEWVKDRRAWELVDGGE